MGREDEKIRVLHIDDDPDLARLTATNLERADEQFSVRVATSANEGLEMLTEQTDCIVSDYRMPEATGLDVFETARKRYPEIPFILFTDTGSEKIASRAISAGVSDYLIKGVVAEQYPLLARKIRTNVHRRRAERKAAETEKQLQELAEHTEDALWIFSADWSELQFINAAYEDLFGQPVETIQADPKAFLSAIEPDDRERVRIAMERVSDGETVQVEYRIETSNSGRKWVESRAKPIFEDGAVDRIVGFTRDVSDQVRRQQELESKNEQLERFASVVAHDLRNPWNVAHGYLREAREEHDSEELAIVSDALDRMDEIVTNLLELARAGSLIDSREPVELEKLLESCWRSVAHSDASLQIETELTVSADTNRLSQVFENLFRNAIEHGGESVTVTVGSIGGGGIYIEDDGTGIPEAKRSVVFESGYSATGTGTGFGLAIVREVINAHGWEITATESETGGARFEITGIEPVKS